MRNYLSFGKQRKEKGGFLPYIYARKWEIPMFLEIKMGSFIYSVILAHYIPVYVSIIKQKKKRARAGFS